MSIHPAAELALRVHDYLVRLYPMLSEDQLRGCVVIEMKARGVHEIFRNLDYLSHHDELRGYMRDESLPTLAGFTVYVVRAIPGHPEDEWRVRNLLGTR